MISKLTFTENESKLLHIEEYQDELDFLHPEDAIEPIINASTARSFGEKPQRKLAIVVGHTKRSPGAMGCFPIDTYEYFWNRSLANLILTDSVEKSVQSAIFFRDGTGIEGAYKQVREWQPDACIELHFNAFNKKVIGTETLFANLSESEKFAEKVQNCMVSIYNRSGSTDRGKKKLSAGNRGYKSVSQLTDLPSCLIEPFFGDAESDAVLAKEKMNLLSVSILNAFIEYTESLTVIN